MKHEITETEAAATAVVNGGGGGGGVGGGGGYKYINALCTTAF